MEYVVALIACVLTLVILKLVSGRRKTPPGPWGLPIVGYIPFLSKKPYLDLQRLAKKYGDIFSIKLGSNYVVVLNDYQSTKAAFGQDVFVARPPDFAFQLNEVTKKTGAILGYPWLEQRRLSLHMLRDLGFGKTKMEGHIQEEITELLNSFQQNVGKPFYPRSIMAPSMSNIIGALMFGKRFDYDDPIRQMMTNTVSEAAKAAAQTGWQLFFPWLRRILNTLGIGDVKRIERSNKELRAFIMNEINEHERTLNSENVRDFIDGYLLEMQKRKGEPTFNKEVLQDIAGAYFGAGSETVRLSVEWLLLAVADNQEQQRRIHAEIDEVVGKERMPIYPDQQKMPFTNAFMMEMQRWKTLTPLNLLRYTLADTELGGYFIPKHTQILNNLWGIHYNAKYWGSDVEEFRPERFLEKDGKTIKKHEQFIPFSTGKRQCPGKPLAKIEMFMYFVSIMQRYNVRFPDGKKANFDSDLGIGLTPKLQEIILTERA